MISNENILSESRMEEMHRQMARFSGWGWGEEGWINHCWKTQSYKVWIADKLQASGQEKQETYRKVLVFWKSGEKKHYKEGKTRISMTMSVTKFCLESILSSRYWVSKMDWGWGNRRWDGWMASPTQGHEFEQVGSWWWTAKPGMLQSMGLKSQTWLK